MVVASLLALDGVSARSKGDDLEIHRLLRMVMVDQGPTRPSSSKLSVSLRSLRRVNRVNIEALLNPEDRVKPPGLASVNTDDMSSERLPRGAGVQLRSLQRPLASSRRHPSRPAAHEIVDHYVA